MSFLDELNNVSLRDTRSEEMFEYIVKERTKAIQKNHLLNPSIKKEYSGYCIFPRGTFGGLTSGRWSNEKYNGYHVLLSDKDDVGVGIKLFDSLKEAEVYVQPFSDILRNLGFTKFVVRPYRIYLGTSLSQRNRNRNYKGPVDKYIIYVYVSW